MEVGLMEIVRSVNRSWIYDTKFSLYRAFHPGGIVRGKCPGKNVRGEMSGYPYIHLSGTGEVFIHTFPAPEKCSYTLIWRHRAEEVFICTRYWSFQKGWARIADSRGLCDKLDCCLKPRAIMLAVGIHAFCS